VPTVKTALGSPVVVMSARFVWADSMRLWTVVVVHRWLEVLFLVSLELVAPQMRHLALASPARAPAGRR
jgi:hypothetical protein